MSQNIRLIVYPLKNVKRNSLVVQWLGLSIFTARAWIQSLGVGELRPCKPHSAAKKTQQNVKHHLATMDRPRDYQTKWSKPNIYDITYMWNLKKKDTNELIHKTERLTDPENKLMTTKEEKD